MGLFWWVFRTASAQVAAPTDSITQALNRRLLQGPVSPLLRVVQVRQAAVTAGSGAAGSVYFAELGIAAFVRGYSKRLDP